MKPSSTWPSALPFLRRTVIDASETIVPMPMRWRRAILASGTRAHAVVADHHAAVFRIRVEARAAVQDEIERELPFLGREFCVRLRRQDFGAQVVGSEAAAEGARDEVLNQGVERRHHRQTRLDRPRRGRLPRGRRLDEFQRLRGHDDGARQRTGAMAASAGALQQARHALRAADLQHLIDRREVDPEIEARRANHRPQALGTEPFLDPVADFAFERSVV